MNRNNIKLLGPGTIQIGGIDAGYVSGVELEITPKLIEAKTAAYGDGVLDYFDGGTEVSIAFMMDEINFQQYSNATAAAATNTNSAGTDLTMGKFVGTRLSTYLITYVPIDSTIATAFSLTIWRAAPTGKRKIDMGIEKTQGLAVTFQALVNEASADGEKYFRWGNIAVSPNATAPTLSTIAPANDSSTAHGSVSDVVMTFSHALDPGSVTAKNFGFYVYDVADVETPIAGALTIDTTGAIITFTPTVPFTAGAYVVVLGVGIKDGNQNYFAGALYNFTLT